MPIYNFKCERCGEEFEAIVKLGVCAIPCIHCSAKFAFKQFTPTRFIPFRSFVDYDMTGQPIEIGSPQQFSKELHKRGLEITDRPMQQRRKRKFGASEKLKKEVAEKLGKELADATA